MSADARTTRSIEKLAIIDPRDGQTYDEAPFFGVDPSFLQ